MQYLLRQPSRGLHRGEQTQYGDEEGLHRQYRLPFANQQNMAPRTHADQAMIGFEVHGEESKENVEDTFGGCKQEDHH